MTTATQFQSLRFDSVLVFRNIFFSFCSKTKTLETQTTKVLHVLQFQQFARSSSQRHKRWWKQKTLRSSAGGEGNEALWAQPVSSSSSRRNRAAPCAEWCARATPRGARARTWRRRGAQRHSSCGCCCRRCLGKAAKKEQNHCLSEDAAKSMEGDRKNKSRNEMFASFSSGQLDGGVFPPWNDYNLGLSRWPHPHVQASRQQPQEAPLSCGATGYRPHKRKHQSRSYSFIGRFQLQKGEFPIFKEGLKCITLQNRNIITSFHK